MPFNHLIPARPANSTHTTSPARNSTLPILQFEYTIKGASNLTPLNSNNKNEQEEEQCGHIFTTYVLPSFMHLSAFILGFIYFRISENETLYALMEKVFLAVDQSLKKISQDKVIKRLK